MAVTNEKSTQVTNLESSPPVGIPTTDWKGVKRILRFTFEQGETAETPAAGDPGSTAELVKLPAGNIRILTSECYMHRSAFGSGRTLDIGLRAYSTVDGTAIAEDADSLVDGLSVSSAGAALWSAATAGAAVDGLDETAFIQSKEGVTVFATVLGNTIPAGAKLTGFITYVQD